MAVVRRQCKRCGRNRDVKFFRGERGRICATCRKRRTSHASREVRLMENHYITVEEYDRLLEIQGGKCYICQRSPKYNMDVDHDHALERHLLTMGVPAGHAHRRSIRGLLDKRCNRRLLPAAGDDVNTLQRAISYLDNWPSDGVLGADLWVS